MQEEIIKGAFSSLGSCCRRDARSARKTALLSASHPGCAGRAAPSADADERSAIQRGHVTLWETTSARLARARMRGSEPILRTLIALGVSLHALHALPAARFGTRLCSAVKRSRVKPRLWEFCPFLAFEIVGRGTVVLVPPGMIYQRVILFRADEADGA